MKIIFVKKIKADGSRCKKCADVEKRLIESGQMNSINEIVIADERDPESAGMQLAKQHQIQLAPFFIVEEDDETRIFTVYFQFVKEVLQNKDLNSLEVNH
jgi:hypothetical protein